MKRRILEFTFLMAIALMIACSTNMEESNDEQLESVVEKKEVITNESFEISVSDLLNELTYILDDKDLELIKTILNDNKDLVGDSIELKEIHLLEGVISIITKYDLEVFEDNYIEGNYEVKWAKDIMTTADYNKLKELVEEVRDLELDSYFDEAKEVWTSINQLIKSYKEKFEKEENTLLASDFYETYSNYEVEYGKYIYKTDPIDYVNEVVKPRGVIDHFVFMYWWDHIVKLFPEDYMKYIVGYDLTSDGWGGNYAMVWQDYDDERKWHLTIDPADALDENYNYNMYLLDETLIHEFAHILTLNHNEMERRRSDKSNNYTPDEGTLKEESYLNTFYQKFWADMSEEYLIESDYSDIYDDERIYRDNPKSFVTEYSATHPTEDLAESFIYFVTLDKPVGDSIKDQKIRFFYDYPELIEMRSHFRENIIWN